MTSSGSAFTLVEEILDDRVGLVRFFHYRGGQRSAGQAVLEAAEDYFRQWGLKQVRVFSYYAYPFCLFDRTFLFDSMAHVHALLRANGYRIPAATPFWTSAAVRQPGPTLLRAASK